MASKKSKKEKTSLKLELDGVINLVEFQGKKRVKTYSLNHKLALKIVKDGLFCNRNK